MKWLGVVAMAIFIIGSCSPRTDDGLFAKTSPVAEAPEGQK